jgi:hypothetical protein
MKKMIVVAAVLVLMVVAFRRFGPTLHKRAMAKCQEMMAKCQEMMASHQGDVAAELADPRATSNEEPAASAESSG